MMTIHTSDERSSSKISGKVACISGVSRFWLPCSMSQGSCINIGLQSACCLTKQFVSIKHAKVYT